MKLLKPTLLLGGILLLCGLGRSLTGNWNPAALESSRAFLFLFVTIVALGAVQLYVRERKARVVIPIKSRRQERPVVIRRRRPGQW